MSLSQYKAYLACIENGSLTRAAEELGYTQSGVTHLLNALEDTCNLKLLVRDKKKAYPTADGEVLIPYFQEIVEAYDRLESRLNEIHRLDAGLIRLACFTSVSVQWLPGIIADYTAAHPGVELKLYHGTSHENAEWIRAGKVDCAFVTMAEQFEFPVFKLHADPMVAIMPKSHPLAKEQAVRVEDLVQYPYIEILDDIAYETGDAQNIFLSHGVKPKVRFSESNDYAVVAMVEKGLGVSLLPQMLVRKTSRDLAIRPLASGEERVIGLAVRSEERMPPSTAAFIQYAKEWVNDFARG